MKGLFHEQQPVLQHKISTALSRRLGKYLYFNPSCKRIPFCQLHLS
jgi:hypothetical protein